MEEQLEISDLLVVNKIDCIDSKELHKIKEGFKLIPMRPMY